ncbi:hypothetical protein MYX04_05335 [Nitrospiraceae bacterium AH_259_D15_M11_P09]|nr:hypothetical protein [Nitrospiraceae bacterium AH_259_D15_M11_P09]
MKLVPGAVQADSLLYPICGYSGRKIRAGLGWRVPTCLKKNGPWNREANGPSDRYLGGTLISIVVNPEEEHIKT